MLRLSSSSATIDRAFGIALDDLARNVAPYTAGLLDRAAPVFLAGAGYDTPWTRDAAINTWNGAALVYPTEARNTLLSVLDRRDGRLLIGGEYWDAIIWSLGAWAYYLVTADRELLGLAVEATRNSLRFFEETELTARLNLFRGPAVYGDGIAAYPDVYAHTEAGSSSIARWLGANPELAARPGVGLPMHALSTNCVYVRAYEVAQAMAEELGAPVDPAWVARAERLRQSINQQFWMAERGAYRYLVDPFGGSDVQEGLAHAFVVLFGIANAEQRQAVLRHQHVAPAGVPCLWPPFDRYVRDDHVGRHSGTVWPPIQAFWAEAAARHGRDDLFAFELHTLAAHAVRDGQFFELYHPQTGLPYGGLQEREGVGLDVWESLPHQTWSATGFLRMVLLIMAGLRFEPDGVGFEPRLPAGLDRLELQGLRYRGMTIDLALRGQGSHLERGRINGEDGKLFLPAGRTGRQVIEARLVETPRPARPTPH